MWEDIIMESKKSVGLNITLLGNQWLKDYNFDYKVKWDELTSEVNEYHTKQDEQGGDLDGKY